MPLGQRAGEEGSIRIPTSTRASRRILYRRMRSGSWEKLWPRRSIRRSRFSLVQGKAVA